MNNTANHGNTSIDGASIRVRSPPYVFNRVYLGGVDGRIDEEIENLLVVNFDVRDRYAEGRLDAGVHFLKYVRKGSGRNAPVLTQTEK